MYVFFFIFFREYLHLFLCFINWYTWDSYALMYVCSYVHKYIHFTNYTLLFNLSVNTLIWYCYSNNKNKTKPMTGIYRKANTSFRLYHIKWMQWHKEGICLKNINFFYSTFSLPANGNFLLLCIQSVFIFDVSTKKPNLKW